MSLICNTLIKKSASKVFLCSIIANVTGPTHVNKNIQPRLKEGTDASCRESRGSVRGLLGEILDIYPFEIWNSMCLLIVIGREHICLNTEVLFIEV
jgi:hypothetical protein